MRFVPIKSGEQQASLMLHRVRDQLIGQRTATINAPRGHLAELGIVAAQRQAGVRQLLAALGDLEDDRIPPLAREVLEVLVAHLRQLEIAALDRRLVALTRSDPICRALGAAPGGSPVIATAFAATVPDATALRSGRHLAAWLGLVRRQHATGGKTRHLSLSQRGDADLRRQLIHGARALVKVSQGGTEALWSWVNGLRARRPFNVVVAAVANKLARIIWAMLSRGEAYRAARSTRSRAVAPGTHPRAARADFEVMAGSVGPLAWDPGPTTEVGPVRRGQSPRWSTSPELVRMMGCRFADLVEASGQPAAPKGRMDGSSQDRHARCFENPLQKREASLDQSK